MTDAMSHHFSLACVQLDRQCALPCIGMLAGAMSRMFVGFPGCIVRPRRAAAHVQIQQRFILAILDRYQSHLLNMQQEGKINMEVIQTLANEKMLANYIDHKCACCAVLCGAGQCACRCKAVPVATLLWPVELDRCTRSRSYTARSRRPTSAAASIISDSTANRMLPCCLDAPLRMRALPCCAAGAGD